MRFLHAADLHLATAERAYSLGALEEIIRIAAREKCGAILLAGDVFDSYRDMEALRGEFRDRLESLPPDCAVFFIPGNHEELRSPSGRAPLSGLDLGRARIPEETPFQLFSLSPEAELLCLPFRRDYSDYRNWPAPPKKRPLRILLAHGLVPGIVYTGPEEESPAGTIDPDLFGYLSIDLAALGHIHAGSITRIGDTTVAYPGSARVWREGETGPRQVFLGATDTIPPRLVPVRLESAGAFVPLSLSVGLDGEVRLPQDFGTPGKMDWLHLEVSGVVEDERPVLEEARKIVTSLEKNCRRVTTDTAGLEVLAGISTHPLAREFLKRWEELARRRTAKGGFGGPEGDPETEADDVVFHLARRTGLSVLKSILEGRK